MSGDGDIGFVFHERFLQHDPGPAVVGSPPQPYPYLEPEAHVEHPRRVGRVKELLDQTGLTSRLRALEFEAASLDDVALFHTREYIDQVVELSTRDGYSDAGEGARLSRGSVEIALLAAGGTCAAVDAVLDGSVARSYALVRPPGHHAVAHQGMGFCLFGNVAIAVKRALARGSAERVLIFDWDVHHGNGTQSAFVDDERVLMVSLHQEGLYPENSGLLDETGEGSGAGYTVNVPLPAGTGDAGYLETFERVVAPIARQFRPDLIVVSNGLDASRSDPLGRMMVTAGGFRSLTRKTMTLADELCGGKLALIHEGGYSQSYAPLCGLAIIEELAGVDSGLADDLGGQARADRMRPAHEVGLDVERALAEVMATQQAYWELAAAVVD
jgi:acetoin utilization deacetylase AcuC-like enzyme